jgi:endoglucanase
MFRNVKVYLIALLIMIAAGIMPGTVYAAPGYVENASDGVAENGWLSVKGTTLVNEQGQPVVLHGMSSHGLQWYPQFTTSNAIGATASYGANLFRVAMYTAEGGYIENKSSLRKQLYRSVDAAISRNMYVIIDWHILSDGNPKKYQKEAKAFFKKVSRRYGNVPNVIYEICNEPNGEGNWNRIRSYAKAVIPVIRRNAPSSVILWEPRRGARMWISLREVLCHIRTSCTPAIFTREHMENGFARRSRLRWTRDFRFLSLSGGQARHPETAAYTKRKPTGGSALCASIS